MHYHLYTYQRRIWVKWWVLFGWITDNYIDERGKKWKFYFNCECPQWTVTLCKIFLGMSDLSEPASNLCQSQKTWSTDQLSPEKNERNSINHSMLPLYLQTGCRQSQESQETTPLLRYVEYWHSKWYSCKVNQNVIDWIPSESWVNRKIRMDWLFFSPVNPLHSGISTKNSEKYHSNNSLQKIKRTRGQMALTITWVSETLHIDFLSEGLIFAN